MPDMRLARQAYVDALIRAAANLSKRRGCCASDDGESYEETLASAAARLAARPGARWSGASPDGAETGTLRGGMVLHGHDRRLRSGDAQPAGG